MSGKTSRSCIVIAGGEGFVGANLARTLVTRGIPVITIDNGLFAPAALVEQISGNPLLTRISATASSADELAQALHGVSARAIVNCVGPARPTYYRKHPVESAKGLVSSTANLLELARVMNASFVQASSSEVYGSSDQPALSEENPGVVSPLSRRAAYAEAKRFCETLAWQYGQEFAVPVRILRLFNIYGPGFSVDDDRVIPNVLRCLQRQEPFLIQGDGRQVRSFCHVNDATDAFVRAVELPGAQALCVNVGNPEPISISELAFKIARIARRDIPINFEPAFDDEVFFRCPDITRARVTLHWSPKIALDDGLKGLILGHSV